MSIHLEIRVSPELTFAFLHPGPRCRVGRNPDAELTLTGRAVEGVSFDHARIELCGDGAQVADAGSTNGTYLNGLRIAGAVPVHCGDEIRLGRLGPALRVRAVGPAAAREEPRSRERLSTGSWKNCGRPASAARPLRELASRNIARFLLAVAVALLLLLARHLGDRVADDPLIAQGCLAGACLVAVWAALAWRERAAQTATQPRTNTPAAAEPAHSPSPRRSGHTPIAC